MAAERLPVHLVCRVLDFSESGYYDRKTRAPSQRAIRHAWLTDLILQIHLDSRRIYGSRRVHAELRLGHRVEVGHRAVEMLMRRVGIASAAGRPKWKRSRPDSIAADRVERQFARSEFNQLWVTDVTDHPTQEGNIYNHVPAP